MKILRNCKFLCIITHATNKTWRYEKNWRKNMKSLKKVCAFFLSLLMVIGVFANSGLKINAETNNTVTVYYYNTWDEAYIHYRQANGEWTNVPGVKMYSSDKGEYRWKATINLGSNSSTEVCFNNGKGVWDSRNGSNYVVSKGVSGVKNGNVTSLAVVTPTPELFTCDFNMNVTSPQTVDTSVGFTGYAYNMPGHRYNNFMYQIHKQGTDASQDKHLQAYTDYSKETTCYTASYKFTEEGTYDVTFKAMQYSGYTAKKTKTIVITKKPEAEKTVFFSNYYAKWDKVYAYVWTNNSDAKVFEAKPYDKIAKTYVVTIPGNYKNIIFKNTEYGWDKQTNDLQIPTGYDNCYRPKSQSNRPEGSWYEYNDKAFTCTLTIQQSSPQNVGTEISLLGVNGDDMPGHRYNSYYFRVHKQGTSEDNYERVAAVSVKGGYSGTWRPTEAGTYEVSYCAANYCGYTAVDTKTFVIR